MLEGREGREGAVAEPLPAVRDLVRAALAALEASRERIDNLNVYPVPDGDTGTNLSLTVRAVHDALAATEDASAEELARAVTRACLLGARGNSGVILSQIVRGAAEALAEAGTIDAGVLALCLRRGSEAAYGALREPKEGTILTLARELAERAEELAPSNPPLGLALDEIIARGESALARTPDQLPILREAGVVDAGAAGLLEVIRGIRAEVCGEPLAEAPVETEPLPFEAVHRELSRYRYCTSFYVEGDEVERERLERELCAFGDSVLVVGSTGALKAHVHTDDPGRALSLATTLGVVEEVEVQNMHVQTAEREERLTSEAETAVSGTVAVVAGTGNARLFRSLGATRIVEGGNTMNPSASALLRAIDSVPATEVLVLPNNPNVLLTAEQAAKESVKRVLVVPTRSLQAGLAAMVAFDPERDGEENADEMQAAAAAVRAGAVVPASRASALGPIHVEQGEFLGLVDEEAVASGRVLEEVARDVVDRLLAERADVLTILLGDGMAGADALRDELAKAYPALEIEIREGGQPHYPLLFSVE